MEKLKPCPFCGSENLKYSRFMSGVRCNECGAMSPASLTKDSSIREWNTRYERTCVPFDAETNLSGTDCPAWICSECSQLFEAGAKYCSNCGARVEVE